MMDLEIQEHTLTCFAQDNITGHNLDINFIILASNVAQYSQIISNKIMLKYNIINCLSWKNVMQWK